MQAITKRKNSFRIFSGILLLMNGVPALISGGNMIFDPSGKTLGLNLSLLQTSPFNSFLIPGIILFVMNGLLSFVVFFTLLLRKKFYPLLVICQGIILTVWIAIQIMIITDPSWLQLTYGFLGLALIAAGLSLENMQARKKSKRFDSFIHQR